MARSKHTYYTPRQVIKMDLVSENDYTDLVLLCIPKFGWDVARAFLSRQAQWNSTYGFEFHDAYYLGPNDEEMDVIKATIDETLARGDMSCDIDVTLEQIRDAINALVAKECGVGCGGSGGAGTSEGPENPYEDDGENPPDGFDTYEDYSAWKCAAAKLILDRLLSDLNWLKGLAITEVTATVLGAALLTPIPLDDVGVLVGLIVAVIVEATLDYIIQLIIDQLELDYDTLLCSLYEAINTSEAVSALEDWTGTYFDDVVAFILNIFINNDMVDPLFAKSNLLIGSADCSECGGGPDTWEMVQGTSFNRVGMTYTGTSTPQGGGHRLEIRVIGNNKDICRFVDNALSDIEYTVVPGTDIGVAHACGQTDYRELSDPFDPDDFGCEWKINFFSYVGSFYFTFDDGICP